VTPSSVYILSSRTRVLYTGVTSDLLKRVTQHRAHIHAGFSGKYQTLALVYYEIFNDIEQAIAREKAIKGMRRSRKVHLIESLNPEWKDLANDLFF
jgi:putative endonuclease